MDDDDTLTPEAAATVAREHGLSVSDALALRGLVGPEGTIGAARKIAAMFAAAPPADPDVAEIVDRVPRT